MKLRAFTEEGVRLFENYILELKRGAQAPFPETLLDGPHTISISNAIDGDLGALPEDKYEAARYLHTLLKPLSPAKMKENSRGIWTWLAAFYFESIRPAKEDALPRAPYHYIYDKQWIRRYRHLLAFPHELFSLYRSNTGNGAENIKLFLNGSVRVLGGIIEQLASRQEIITSRPVVRALTALYWEPQTDAPKTGITTDDRDRTQRTNRTKKAKKAKRQVRQRKATLRLPGAGGIVRFVKVFWQLHLTYDLYSLDADQILDLLPPEFDRYRASRVALGQ
ncbi:hypothetical protein [Archangium primigenium]|uniref:hypothetical protein n=1 Tax=[Archangium] primigenium TaxID=2792470 RepID=UPI00195764F1|nr:hypothetical protein [Archangium primigenium]MBM7117948.1 hypothetical protein [Archangium primigenium]